MQVTSISVNVRYSKQTADGSYKTVELGCEGNPTNSDEHWHEVQAELYRQRGEQMRYVFSGNGSGKAQNGPEKAVPATTPTPLPPPPPPEHWCTTHKTEYERFEKNSRVWYSHKAGDGWCKET
jgi:hypothetical protein